MLEGIVEENEIHSGVGLIVLLQNLQSIREAIDAKKRQTREAFLPHRIELWQPHNPGHLRRFALRPYRVLFDSHRTAMVDGISLRSVVSTAVDH